MSDTREVVVHLDVDSLLSRFGYDHLTIHSVNELIAQQTPELRDFDRDALTWIYHYEPELGFVAADPEAPPFDADRYVAEQLEIARYRGDDLEWAVLNARGDLDPERFPRFVETMENAYSGVTHRLSRSASALATVARYEDAWATAWGRLAELQASDREEYERRLVAAIEAAAAAEGATLQVVFGGFLHMDFLFDDEEPSGPTFDWEVAQQIADDAISGEGFTAEGRLLSTALRSAKLPFADATPFQYGDGTGELEQVVQAELASDRLPHQRLEAFETAKPAPDEPHDPVSDWAGKTVGHVLESLERLEELLALKPELDPEVVVAEGSGARCAVEQWFASGPVSLSGYAYDQWLSTLDPTDTPWSSSGLPRSREELAELVDSWDGLLAFFLQREERRRRREIQKPAWWQQPDKYECSGNTRFWKTHLRSMEDAYGAVPELPEREVPYVQCELRRGHVGDHSAFLGEDQIFERWFVSWKDDEDYFAQRLFADLRCDVVDGSPVLHRPELVRHCTLVRGHGGDCRFDGRPEPLVSIEDYCSDTDWARLCWIRERMLGTEPTAVRPAVHGGGPKPGAQREVDDSYLLRDLAGRVADLETSWNGDTLVVTVAPDAAMSFRVFDGALEMTFRRTSMKPGEEFTCSEPLGGSRGSSAVDFAESMVRDAIQDEQDADGPSDEEVAGIRALAEALEDLKPTLQITEHGASLAVPFDDLSRVHVSTLDGEFLIVTWFETPEVSGNGDEVDEPCPISEVGAAARTVREVLREMPRFKLEFVESLHEMHGMGDLSAADLAAASSRLLG